MKNKKPLEWRSYQCDIRADESGHVITGKPIVFGSETDLGYCREVIEAGALDKADLTDVRFMVNHDFNKIPLARSRKNTSTSTLQLHLADDGLEIMAALDSENNADARSLYSAIKRGDITGMSFCFTISEDEWEDIDSDSPLHKIRSIGKVIEVSAVNFPAYPDTEIDARSAGTVETVKRSLDNARAQKAEAVETALKLEKEKIKLWRF